MDDLDPRLVRAMIARTALDSDSELSGPVRVARLRWLTDRLEESLLARHCVEAAELIGARVLPGERSFSRH